MPAYALENTADRYRDADAPFLSARRVAEGFGLSLSDLSRLAGVARNTLTAKSGARRVDDALSPLVRILAMATEMTGDDSRTAVWFKHQPLPGYAGQTARDLVAEGKGEAVLRYLEAVRQGVYA